MGGEGVGGGTEGNVDCFCHGDMIVGDSLRVTNDLK